MKKALAMLLVAAAAQGALADENKFRPEQYETKTNGTIELNVDRDSPIFAEFEKSPELTKRLRAALTSQGFTVVEDRAAAKAELVMRGELRLMGGPQFYKGMVVPVGEVTEKALKEGELKGEVTRGDVVGTVADVAIASAGYGASLTPFMKGLNLSFMVASIGEATGFTGAINKAFGMDPRGICLSRCETWKIVEQTVLTRVVKKDSSGEKEVRTMSKVSSETIAPQEVIQYSVGKLIENIKITKQTDATPAVGQTPVAMKEQTQ